MGRARGGHEREAREGDDGTERRAISLIINSNILQKVIASDWGRGSLSHVGHGFRPKIVEDNDFSSITIDYYQRRLESLFGKRSTLTRCCSYGIIESFSCDIMQFL